MRLLRTNDLTNLGFEQFYEQDLPPYAILSHTWSKNPEEEVLYLDVIRGTSTEKPACDKVKAALMQAHKDDFDYCWIDTCCIDKSSSAELSEAINSMYRWYREATICYAYLQDVSAIAESNSPDSEALFEALKSSRWFTRGWTLQELLAPSLVQFYSQEWGTITTEDAYLGNKCSLRGRLSQITGIEEDIVTGDRPVQSASVAQRLSWSAHRKTSRLEDEAYCLMGLFDVNMPMLYGEGAKAFIRLQEEIMKYSEDESIFAWYTDPTLLNDELYHGLLADSPKDFAHSGNVLQHQLSRPKTKADLTSNVRGSTWTMTNRGLSLRLPLLEVRHAGTTRTSHIAVLGCQIPDVVGFLGVNLERIREDQYARVDRHRIEHVYEPGIPEQLFIPQVFAAADPPRVADQIAFQVGHIHASGARHWLNSGSGKSDYKVECYFNARLREQGKLILLQYASFSDDDISLPIWTPDKPRWISVAAHRKHPRQPLATFCIASVYYQNQFALHLYLRQRHDGQPNRLSFQVFEQPLGALETSPPWHRTHSAPLHGIGKEWVDLNGDSIRGISVDAIPHDVPGGRYFELSIAVQTNVKLRHYPVPNNAATQVFDNQTTSVPGMKNFLKKIRGPDRRER